MDNQSCPKCGGEMDEGAVSNSEGVRYVSNRQKGILKAMTPAKRARVCLHCGYYDPRQPAESVLERRAAGIGLLWLAAAGLLALAAVASGLI